MAHARCFSYYARLALIFCGPLRIRIGKFKIAIQKLTDRRPDDLSFCGPQKFRASRSMFFVAICSESRARDAPALGRSAHFSVFLGAGGKK